MCCRKKSVPDVKASRRKRSPLLPKRNVTGDMSGATSSSTSSGSTSTTRHRSNTSEGLQSSTTAPSDGHQSQDDSETVSGPHGFVVLHLKFLRGSKKDQISSLSTPRRGNLTHHLTRFPRHIPSYTDGSKNTGRVSVAAVLINHSYGHRIHDHSSIFTAEARAILMHRTLQ